MEKNEKVFQRTQEEMESKFESMSKQLEQMQRHHEIQKERVGFQDSLSSAHRKIGRC